ncbi:MAG: STAS domain-containing protein [Anaerovoracaceae bacterium]|mgnify:CR=1 FL=1|nr:STAS domain-containing protein [Bacillota bacterium]
MTINKEKNNGILTLAIEGRLDTVTAPELEKVVNEETADVRELILDMKGLEYISSAGLRVLLAAQKKMNKQGVMKLTDVCDAVMEVFEMTGFADILTIE